MKDLQILTNLQDGTQAEYWYQFLGGIPPTPPTPTYTKKKFPWVIFARKLRNKRNFIGIELEEKYFNIAKQRIEKAIQK